MGAAKCPSRAAFSLLECGVNAGPLASDPFEAQAADERSGALKGLYFGLTERRTRIIEVKVDLYEEG